MYFLCDAVRILCDVEPIGRLGYRDTSLISFRGATDQVCEEDALKKKKPFNGFRRAAS